MLNFGTVAGETARQVSGGKRGDVPGMVRSAYQARESQDFIIPDGCIPHFPESRTSRIIARPAFPGGSRNSASAPRRWTVWRVRCLIPDT